MIREEDLTAAAAPSLDALWKDLTAGGEGERPAQLFACRFQDCPADVTVVKDRRCEEASTMETHNR